MLFWTRQHPAVLDELDRTGCYTVKKEYIEEKNDTIADFYLGLYEWYTRKSRQFINIPENLQYPIWLSVSEDMMLQPTEGAVILTVDIPEDQYIICNFDKWGYRVNSFYVPLDKADEEKHLAELKRYGIGSEDDLINTSLGNFYPLLKQKIIKSWDRIFTIEPDSPELAVGTCWILKKEWVKEVRHYVGE